nr:protein eceriferum 3 [Tanacetum cinerariifolium]
MLPCHGQVDDVIEYKLGEKSTETIYPAGKEPLVFMTGATSKLGRSIALYLARRKVRVM